jgi:hypothetical protein
MLVVGLSTSLTTLLRHVVFVREPPLGSGFDGQRIGLYAMGSGDEFVMGVLCLAQPGRPLGDIIGEGRDLSGLENLRCRTGVGQRRGGLLDQLWKGRTVPAVDGERVHASPSTMSWKVSLPARTVRDGSNSERMWFGQEV